MATIAPELGQIPPHLWEGALQAIAQTDPGRAQAIANTLDKAQRIQFATQQQAQQQAQIAQQQNDALRQQYAKASDEALAMTTAEKMAMADELVNYVGKYGVSREALMQEASTNLLLHHPAFNAMAADALKYQRLMANARNIPSKVPPVQRPGVARDRESPVAEGIKAVWAQLQAPRAKLIRGQVAHRSAAAPVKDKK